MYTWLHLLDYYNYLNIIQLFFMHNNTGRSDRETASGTPPGGVYRWRRRRYGDVQRWSLPSANSGGKPKPLKKLAKAEKFHGKCLQIDRIRNWTKSHGRIYGHGYTLPSCIKWVDECRWNCIRSSLRLNSFCSLLRSSVFNLLSIKFQSLISRNMRRYNKKDS